MAAEGSPEWFTTGQREPEARCFKPQALDRYGERLAWSLAAALTALTLFMFWRQGVWIAALIVITSLCIVAALLISYGNWMERRTEIEVTAQGLRYRNPLRELRADWGSIMAVFIYPRGDGWRVIIESDSTSFSFQTQTTLRLGWGREVETGIIDGLLLTSNIVGSARLGPPYAHRDGWARRRAMITDGPGQDAVL